MKSKVLLLKAEKHPVNDSLNLLPNQIYKNTHVQIEEQYLGELDANSIRVKMLYVGICGSDYHLMKTNPETGYIETSVPVSIPDTGRVIGHEGVGQILDVGTNVHHLKSGMYVTFESIVVCNHCDVCKRGDFNQCRNAQLIGLETDGIMGEIVDINANLAHNVTEYISSDNDLKAMACIEPVGVAYDACENARVGAGDIVVVFGGGPIGAYCAILSKYIFGVSRVYVVEPSSFRRNLVSKWADAVYDSLQSLRDSIEAVDVIIEASGDLTNVSGIFNSIDANGRVVLLARSGENLTINSIDHMITNNITIVGSRGHLCGAFRKILRLYNSGKLPLLEIVTKVVDGLDNLANELQSENIVDNDCKVLANICDVFCKGEKTNELF